MTAHSTGRSDLDFLAEDACMTREEYHAWVQEKRRNSAADFRDWARRSAIAEFGGTRRTADEARPVQEYGTRLPAPVNGPTEKQLGFLTKLASERGVEVPAVETKQQASDEITRLLATPKKRVEVKTITNVPAGHYATESRTGNNDLDFWRVDRPTEGKWAGYTFVKRVIGGQADVNVRGAEKAAALEAIELAGDLAASQLYGREIGRCGVCNRHLTDETSRERGIGPECWSRVS